MNRRLLIVLFIVFSVFLISGCNNKNTIIETNNNILNEETNKMRVIIDNNEYIINLEDNLTSKKLLELSPLEVTMEELNGNEKYVYLSDEFPNNPYKVSHIEKGDVMLFGNNCLVIFYKSFDTSYSYTKIGHIDNLPSLGNGNIKAKFLTIN